MNMRAEPKEKPGAIFHFACKVHGRSTGANAVRLAAYRAGERLRSDLTGRIHNYTRKTEVAFKAILAPDVSAPWVTDRGVLWNTVDSMEARKDAQLAREVEVALPLALSQGSTDRITDQLGSGSVRVAGDGRGRLSSRQSRQSPCPHPVELARHRARRIRQEKSIMECAPAP